MNTQVEVCYTADLRSPNMANDCPGPGPGPFAVNTKSKDMSIERQIIFNNDRVNNTIYSFMKTW